MRTEHLPRTSAALAILLIIFTGCATLGNETGQTPENPDPAEFEQVGTVTAENTEWNWLFLKNADKRAAVLEELVREAAAQNYGDDVVVVTEQVDGRWSPASLLMLFSAAGFVEDAEIEASVWRKRPEPAPEPDPLKYGIRYRVIPEADYNGDWGFMKVEYRTRSELEEELTEKLESGEISDETHAKRLKRLPETGKIFITLAREDITNAISRWFTFTCTRDGKTVFRKRGTEDIPYVYGTDKLWWNDMAYNVGPAWDGELKLVINDSYRNEVFSFRIVKERYVIEE